MFQIATGILIFHGNLKYLCAEDKSFSDNFSRLLVNSYCCPKRLAAYMIDISFTCHHCVSDGKGYISVVLRNSLLKDAAVECVLESILHILMLYVFRFSLERQDCFSLQFGSLWRAGYTYVSP